MEPLRYHWSVASGFARLAIQRQLEYPLFLVSWFLMIPFQYFAGVWLLKVLVDKFQSLGGWNFPEIAFLYGLALLSHGLQVVFFIQTWNIEHYVTEGQFDRMLLRPVNVFFQFCVNYINFIGLIDLIPGAIIFGIGCKLTGFVWSPLHVVELVLVIVGAVFIRTGIFTMLSSVAFWTMRSRSLAGTGLAILQNSTLYPLTIYPRGLQMALTFLFPAGFIAFYPAADFLGKRGGGLPLEFALWTPLVGLLCFAASQALFVAGLKRYESSGS